MHSLKIISGTVQKRALIFGPSTVPSPTINITIAAMVEPVSVTIRAPSIGLFNNSIILKPGEQHKEYIIDTKVLVINDEEDKLIEISSNDSVAVFGVIGDDGVNANGYSDAVYARPITSCSTQFIVPNYDDPASVSIIAIGTLQAGAWVSIDFPMDIGIVSMRNPIQTVTKLSTVNPIGGSKVPFMPFMPEVVIFSGGYCVNVPIGVPTCGLIWAPVTPNCDLGLVHVVPPIPGRVDPGSYIVRVFATQDGTVVEWWSPATASYITDSINTQQYTEILNPGSGALSVNCSKPCNVVQINIGGSADGTVTGIYFTG